MGLSDLIGKKIGLWTVLNEAPRKNGMRYFRCRCECGNIHAVQGVALNNGASQSCGCSRSEHAAAMGQAKRTHGESKTRFYRIWKGMRNRCLNKNEPAYSRYGGRGIRICERWATFEKFREDMYSAYAAHAKLHGEANTSIDRIDSNGNYCLENCRWATDKIQSKNRRPMKLSKGDIEQIRREYRPGQGRRLAKRYNVTGAVVSEIVNHRRNYAEA